MRFGSARQLIRLAPLALSLLTACSEPRSDAPARFLGQFTWQMADARFGGWSGLELAPDGVGMVAISDRGTLLRGRILRDDDQITGIEVLGLGAIRTDQPAESRDVMRDTEGLALGPGGALYISLEGLPRVLRLTSDGPAVRLPGHPAFDALPSNGALETLAIDPEGRLVTIPEKSSAWRAPFPVWRLEDGTWRTVFSITRDPGFLPVGGDFGPDGALYVLERGFNGLGFRTRVRRFDSGATGVQKGLVVFAAPVLAHDNLEGLAVWRDGRGRIRLTMISDDNFRALQRTEIVEYVIENPLQ